jgi:hypothetical protein
LPIEATADKPTTRRSAALWIGPLALAVGALVAGSFILGTRENPKQPASPQTPVPSVASAQMDMPNTRATSPTSSSVEMPMGSAAESGTATPAASVVSSANTPPSAEPILSTAPVRSTVHVVVPKASTKTSPTPPPIPTDPNF